MTGPKLSLKFKDAIVYMIKQTWLGLVLAIGLAAYTGHLQLYSAHIIILILCVAILIPALIATYGTTETLTTNGISYKEPFKETKNIEWSHMNGFNPSKKYPDCLDINCDGKDKPLTVHKCVLLYTDVSAWIKNHAPEQHFIREFCK